MCTRFIWNCFFFFNLKFAFFFFFVYVGLTKSGNAVSLGPWTGPTNPPRIQHLETNQDVAFFPAPLRRNLSPRAAPPRPSSIVAHPFTTAPKLPNSSWSESEVIDGSPRSPIFLRLQIRPHFPIRPYPQFLTSSPALPPLARLHSASVYRIHSQS
jgi:hypothetical protein